MSERLRDLRERRLGHGEERVLDGKALMIGKSGKERGANLAA